MTHLPSLASKTTVKRIALLSSCGQFRYSLSLNWDEKAEKVTFIMLNPSTADLWKDDTTFRRRIGFARRWEYCGFYAGNLLAWGSPEPEALLTGADPEWKAMTQFSQD